MCFDWSCIGGGTDVERRKSGRRAEEERKKSGGRAEDERRKSGIRTELERRKKGGAVMGKSKKSEPVTVRSLYYKM